MSKYKWDNPYEWLEEKSREWSRNQLRVELLDMAQSIGFDSIQDIYESDMVKDGYFDELEDH